MTGWLPAHRKAILIICLALAVPAIVAAGVLATLRLIEPEPSMTSSPGGNVSVGISLSKSPALDEPVEVSVTVKARVPINGPVEAWLELPSTAAYINGQMWWKGELKEGRTHTFHATVAFVAGGAASLCGVARVASPDAVGGADIVADCEERVIPQRGENASYSQASYLMDGSSLLNQSGMPRMFVIRSRAGLEGLRRQGLVPSEMWGMWHGAVFPPRWSLFDNPSLEQWVVVALYDRERPTTGYHLAVRQVSEDYLPVSTSDGGFAYRPKAIILDVVATAPEPGWPVERRPVSPYLVMPAFPVRYFNDVSTIELVMRINDAEAGRYPLTKEASSTLTELSLPGEALLP
jgi:hypothetical protein